MSFCTSACLPICLSMWVLMRNTASDVIAARLPQLVHSDSDEAQDLELQVSRISYYFSSPPSQLGVRCLAYGFTCCIRTMKMSSLASYGMVSRAGGGGGGKAEAGGPQEGAGSKQAATAWSAGWRVSPGD